MTYQEHQAAMQANQSNGNSTFVKTVDFLGSFLNDANNSVVVRFPYHSKNDFTYTTTHLIKDYPGFKFGKYVICSGKDTCPFCAEGIKKADRSVIKMIAYTIENGKVVPHPCIWDRPSAFADIDLSKKVDLYGDLTNRLFMISKSGKGTDTRYNVDVIDNPTIYPPELYPADFTKLEEADGDKICYKTYAQYQLALNPNAESAQAPQAAQPAPQQAYQAPAQQAEVPFTVNDVQAANFNAPQYQAPAAPQAQASNYQQYQAPQQNYQQYQAPVNQQYNAPQYQAPATNYAAPQENTEEPKRTTIRRF